MSLDESILHCKDVARKCTIHGSKVSYIKMLKDQECISEHFQLSSWLKELKEYRKYKEEKTKNMTNEDYVGFEVAKLLKKRGFDEFCNNYYRNDGCIAYTEGRYPNGMLRDDEYSAPTLQRARKWLRKEHGIHISVLPYSFVEESNVLQYHYSIFGKDNLIFYGFKPQYISFIYLSYEEALNEAIKEVLTDFIS